MMTDWFLSTITLRSSNNLQNPPQDFIILDQNADEKEFKRDFEKLSQINFGDYLSMIACGSNYYAAMPAVWYFKHLKCFKKINVYDPVDL
jgi:glucosamine 6-phosphate synthetase-like amidotransferase/phosphosugar isomerase protein